MKRAAVMEREHTVQVWNQPQKVTVYQRSKTVWIAVGVYLGETLGVKSRTERQALGSWREAARCKGN